MTRSRHAVTHPQIGKAPKQDRSRMSFDRVLDAAELLMEERGYTGFALTDVVKRAKVSIGSIYGRVDSKDELIRAVHQRVTVRLNLEHSDMINRIRRKGLTLTNLLPKIMRELSVFFSRNAAIINSFIEFAPEDRVIASEGKQFYAHTLIDIKLLLLERKSEMVVPDPDHAAEVCFNIIFSTLTKYFGMGSAADAKGEGDLGQILEDLHEVCLVYLTGKRPRVTAPASRAGSK